LAEDGQDECKDHRTNASADEIRGNLGVGRRGDRGDEERHSPGEVEQVIFGLGVSLVGEHRDPDTSQGTDEDRL